MNINEILNSTIAGLLCAIIIALFGYVAKLIKKSHDKNKTMFWYNVSFYFDIFAIVHCAVFFRIDKCSLSPLSLGDPKNSFFFFVMIFNIFFTIVEYKNIQQYLKNHNQK